MLRSFSFLIAMAGFMLGGAIQAQDYDQSDTGRDSSNRGQYQSDQQDGQSQYDQQSRQERPQSSQYSEQWRQDSKQQAGRQDHQQYGRQQYGQQQLTVQQRGRQAGLGVSLSDRGQEGVLVSRVHSGSPAEQAGLETGDEIISVDGQRVDSADELIQMVQQRQPGDSIRLQVRRDGQRQTLQARLESRDEALVTQHSQGQIQGRAQAQFHGQQMGADSQRMLSQVQRMERTIQQLSYDLSHLRNQLEQQRQSAYRGAEGQVQRGQLQSDQFQQRNQQQRDQSQRDQFQTDQQKRDQQQQSQRDQQRQSQRDREQQQRQDQQDQIED